MTPLICFYQEGLSIVSEKYTLHTCPDEMLIKDFLDDLEKKYFKQMKIVQINFEYEQADLAKKQIALYKSAKASVFVLDLYELKSLDQIKKELNIKSIETKISFKSLIAKSDFVQQVNVIKEHIAQGRLYQANLTAPLVSESREKALDLFFHFEKDFLSLYKAYLPLPEQQILSFSPELFLARAKNILITQPIKGSSSSEKDFNQDLYKNKKEQAELSMIVDLLRNDLNSLDIHHAAVVTAHREKMQLGYIQHTYSQIEVFNESSLSFVLDHLMPGGSISGCPKQESLHLIYELEAYKRQAYTGALGWWKENDFTFNLSIRSFIKTPENLIYHAGCGIVYDSEAESEWDEFLLKTGRLHVQ